ncbi:MAG: hypothetical protein JW726_18080 [Anaerolineales bacterium]|nr:hypothetical protein [Anaerolineales bacterium]
MLRRITCLLVAACILYAQAACSASEENTQATQDSYLAETEQAQDAKSTRRAQFTANAQATISIEETIQAQGTQSAEQTAAALDTTATVEAEASTAANATSTAIHAATGTAEVVRRQTATANAIVQATAQAQPMLDLVTRLASEGYLTTTEGNFFKLIDFDESWAQLGWYWFFPTAFSPTDFVIRAHAEWDSASKTPDPWTTGCGFVFREDGIPNHYLTYLGLDGNVYFSRYYKNIYALVGSNYYGDVGFPEGAADIVLAVDGNWITFLVNGEKVLRRQDDALSSGNLNYTLISGTNKDYGTHCRMTNVELWVIK